jgi:predicted amidohydrolase
VTLPETPPPQRRARVAAVQLRPGGAVAKRLDRLVGAASSQGAVLVAVPPAELPSRAAAAMARRHQVYLVTCENVAVGAHRSRIATLTSPEGRLLGQQRQTHLAAEERADGLSPGDELAVFPGPVGPLGLVVNTDVRYPEVARLLCLKGATLLVCPVAARDVPAHDWARRLWREVQANQVFGLEAPLVGNGYGGPATVHAPLEMTPGHDGVLAQASGKDEDATAVADLDLDALQATVDAYPIFRCFNLPLYKRTLPAAYRSPAHAAPEAAP